MSIRIAVDKAKPWYTNHDIVRGSVVLDLKESVEVSDISIGLFGISETSLTRVDDFGQKFTDQVNETSMFLHLDSRLFPPPNDAYKDKYALRAGSHSFEFQFEFPRVSMDKRPLPPSLSDLDKDLAAVRYFLKVEVRQASSGLMRAIGSRTGLANCREIVPLVFLPSDDASLDFVPTYGVFHSKQSRVVANPKTMSGLFSRLVTSIAHDRAPTCSGIALFTVRSELLLTPGLKFSFLVEALSTSDETLSINAIRVELVAKTFVRAKNVDATKETSTVILSRDNLKLKAGDLTAQLGYPLMKLPETVPPSFVCSNVRREYRLDIKLKWTHRPTSSLTHKTLLSRKVWVRSGMQALPNYETGEISTTDREFPQAKWYFDSWQARI